MLAPSFTKHTTEIPIVKTIAAQKKGISELWNAIINSSNPNKLRSWLLAEKAFHLIQQKRMKDVSKQNLKDIIEAQENSFNLYNFIKNY